MKRLLCNRPKECADLLVHLGLGAAVLATVVLATITMLNFGSNVDAIATRLALPPPGTTLPQLAGDPQSSTNVAVGQSSAAVLGGVGPTNTEPAAARAAANRTAG
jgi:hypothetical protein